jgi:hypothetical protein
MTRIVECRSVASPTVLELRVFRATNGRRRACVMSDGVIFDEATMEMIGEPVARAFLDALALCERERIPTLWVNDPSDLFRSASQLAIASRRGGVKLLIPARPAPCRSRAKRGRSKEAPDRRRAATIWAFRIHIQTASRGPVASVRFRESWRTDPAPLELRRTD